MLLFIDLTLQVVSKVILRPVGIQMVFKVTRRSAGIQVASVDTQDRLDVVAHKNGTPQRALRYKEAGTKNTTPCRRKMSLAKEYPGGPF